MFNVTRPNVAPPSLAEKKGYAGEDVLNLLRVIFYDKCYLCEIKDPTSVNIEHFDAHEGDIIKKHDWNNLFYACGRCNNIKLAKYKNLLDCTDAANDVFKLLKHRPPHTPYQGKLEIEAMDDNPKTLETAELLNEIFNTESTVNKRVTGAYLRKKVYARYNRFLALVNDYYDDDLPQARRDDALGRLTAFVSKTQEFSAFIRWIVLEDEQLSTILMDYLD